MSTALTVIGNNGFTQEQVDIVRSQVAPPGTTDQELALFLMYCQRTGLDPFARQIYLSERRWQANGQWNVTRKPETTIDGFRLIAERAGTYAGQLGPEWCGKDGIWRDVWLDDSPPAAARIGVLRHDFKEPLWAVARYSEYVQKTKDGTANSMWAKMPANQLAKCFSPDTEILTDRGFETISRAQGKVLQATDSGLKPTDARPFQQSYTGPMIAFHGDMLDFCVTPNHDMVTTVGKVEARAMFETSFKSRPLWRIPMALESGRTVGLRISDSDLRLAAVIAADGSHNGHLQFVVSVSHPDKIAALESLNPFSRGIVHSRGSVAVTETRAIKSNFDKVRFSFGADRVSPLLGTDKVFANSMILGMTKRQARLVLDTWVSFDGHQNKKTGVRRIYTSRLDHAASIELLAVIAGYSISSRKERTSDISTGPNYQFTISSSAPVPVAKPMGTRPGLVMESFDGDVWCVTVPSGVIVVRRNGFSMLCGNCAESLALRRAFPRELSGLYTRDEMPEPRTEAIEAQRSIVEQALAKQTPAPADIAAWADIDPDPKDGGYEARASQKDAEAQAVAQEATAKLKRKRGSITFEALKEWGIIKTELRKLTGTDELYYAALKDKGYQHADEIANKDDAGIIWKVLSHERNRLRERHELSETLKDAAAHLGGEFVDILGRDFACTNIDEALALDGEQTRLLLARLKEAVDDRRTQ